MYKRDESLDKPESTGSSRTDGVKATEGFDFISFYHNMKGCVSEDVSDHDVGLESYLVAYEQLYNFFILLGGAFQFVASDVKSKIKILNELKNEELKNNQKITNFSTVKSMVLYEKEEKLLSNPKYVSGSRTLLRLHRGLDFFRKFLKEVFTLKEDVKLGSVAKQLYDETLANYHTWVVRNGAKVAMQFLPTRMELINKISQNDEECLNQVLEMFPDALVTVNDVYDKVQIIYSDNNLLELP